MEIKKESVTGAPGLTVKLSKGNSKMGKVLSVSLPPILSCGASLPCFKSCYAAKLARIRTVVRDAWLHNWKMVMTDRDSYFSQIRAAIAEKKPDLFRWHVAGDIPDYDYLGRMAITAESLASEVDTKYLVFTKKTDLLRVMRRNGRTVPGGMSVIVSAWPGLVLPPDIRRNFPVAWMRDPKKPDARIPADAFECGGGCSTCGKCWNLEPGESVVFRIH